jgi:hypothetical protein
VFAQCEVQQPVRNKERDSKERIMMLFLAVVMGHTPFSYQYTPKSVLPANLVDSSNFEQSRIHLLAYENYSKKSTLSF